MSSPVSPRRVFVAAWAALALLVTMGIAAPATADSAASQEIVDETNEHRADHGKAPLVNHNALNEVAQRWSEQMAQDRELYHNPRVGSQIPSGWLAWGENVAYNQGYSNPVSTMMVQWKNSPGHNQNMLRDTYTHIGVGFYTDSWGRSWGTQVFARYTGGLEPSGPFLDVPHHHDFRAQIAWVSQREIATGYDDGRFKPTAPVTRQAMAAFLHRAAGSPAQSGSGAPFPDVSTNHPFVSAIRWLDQEDISGGYHDGTFRPNAPVSRQAMAAFLYRMAGEPTFNAPASPSFSDVPLTHEFYGPIEWLAEVGISTGYSDGTFRGGASVSRQAMAAFLQRYVTEFG